MSEEPPITLISSVRSAAERWQVSDEQVVAIAVSLYLWVLQEYDDGSRLLIERRKGVHVLYPPAPDGTDLVEVKMSARWTWQGWIVIILPTVLLGAAIAAWLVGLVHVWVTR